MNMYPLNEINGKLDKLQGEAVWRDETIDKINQTTAWLMQFAKRVDPFLNQLSDIHQQIVDLRIENDQLRRRSENTAIVHGIVSEVIPGANPPIVRVRHGETVFELYVPQDVFEQIEVQVDMVITAEAEIMSHYEARQRRRNIVFLVARLEIVQSSVDDLSESDYNET